MASLSKPPRGIKETPLVSNSGWGFLLLVIFLVMLVSGCGNPRTGEAEIYGIAKFGMPAFPESGSNVIEIFNEMHYQPSYKSQEGPRLLPPLDSVPYMALGSSDAVTEEDMIFEELTYATLAEYKDLKVPRKVVDVYNKSKASDLFRVNCLVCHGSTLKGLEEEDVAKQPKILRFMPRGPWPADLTSELTTGSTDGELFSFISMGGRQGFAAIERGKNSQSPMPEFLYLLTEAERWTLVMYLRDQ